MHDNLEQYSRKFNLEIHGIPEQESENAERIVLDLAKCLHVNLEPEDIDIAHRMTKGNLQPRPIVVRFANNTCIIVTVGIDYIGTEQNYAKLMLKDSSKELTESISTKI